MGALRDDGKGRHTTTRREILLLPDGGLLLDMPGMRELGLLDAEEGSTDAFPSCRRLAEQCRFRDCKHEAEPGCAVRAAVADGALAPGRLDAWRRLKGELEGRRARRR